MVRFGQLVMGPAGSGKSTYCHVMQEHAATLRRTIHVVNLDPAADHFKYTTLLDVKELVSVDDVMEDEELRLGPNGALVYALEYLVNENLDWLQEQLGDGSDDDYVIFDCPGQIELYTHLDIMPRLVKALQSFDFTLCGVFVLDAQFLLETAKFFSGSLAALSGMLLMELPHINVISKMDLLSERDKTVVESFLDPDLRLQRTEIVQPVSKKHARLHASLGRLLEDYALVQYLPLDVSDEESIAQVALAADIAISYGEGLEVRDRYPEEVDMDEERDNGMTLH